MTSLEATIEEGAQEVRIPTAELSRDLKLPFNREDVVEAFGRLSLKLNDRLEDYDVIISDEASGRIPSLIMRELIRQRREESGKRTDPGYFIAGGRIYREGTELDEIRKFFHDKKFAGKRALLVTELIDSGTSISQLVEMLEDAGVDFDLAALAMQYPVSRQAYDRTAIPRLLEAGRLFYGAEYGSAGKTFHSHQFLFSGVQKDYDTPRNPFPKKVANHQDRAQDVRRDAYIFADRLYEFLKQK